MLVQVLADRSETGSRHGRAAFSVLLFQDLAVVVLLMLIPLLAPKEGAAIGFATISKALGCGRALLFQGKVLCHAGRAPPSARLSDAAPPFCRAGGSIGAM